MVSISERFNQPPPSFSPFQTYWLVALSVFFWSRLTFIFLLSPSPLRQFKHLLGRWNMDYWNLFSWMGFLFIPYGVNQIKPGSNRPVPIVPNRRPCEWYSSSCFCRRWKFGKHECYSGHQFIFGFGYPRISPVSSKSVWREMVSGQE